MSFQHHASWTLDAVMPFQLAADSAAASASLASRSASLEAALHERAHGVQPGDPGSIERLAEAIGERHAGSDLVVDLVRLSELEEVDEAPAVALEGELELRGSFRVADDLVGDGEQLADFVLAALGPVVGVERERERRRVTQPPGERHGLPRQRLAALGLVGEVKLHGEAAEQPGPERRTALGQRGERLLAAAR